MPKKCQIARAAQERAIARGRDNHSRVIFVSALRAITLRGLCSRFLSWALGLSGNLKAQLAT